VHRLFFFSSNVLENIVSQLTYPIIIIQGKFSNLIDFYFQKNQSIENLKKQLKLVQNEKEDLLYDNIRFKATIGYFERIGELVEFKKRYSLNSAITAQIIMKQISDDGHCCYIDKGSCCGVAKDMAAIYKNCLIGKVVEVYPKYSKIVYITDKSCKVAVYCFKTGAIGIYEGLNKLNSAELKYVNHLNFLSKNDLVLSSGEGLIFPQGFALGKISKFTKNEVQYDVTIKLLIDIKSIEYCQLIRK